MANNIHVPESLVGKFNRLMYSIPAEVRAREDVQKTILMYLKLGGVNLARLRIELAKMRFPDGAIFSKRSVQRQGDKDLDGEEESEDLEEAVEEPDVYEPPAIAAEGSDSGPGEGEDGPLHGFFVF